MHGAWYTVGAQTFSAADADSGTQAVWRWEVRVYTGEGV